MIPPLTSNVNSILRFILSFLRYGDGWYHDKLDIPGMTPVTDISNCRETIQGSMGDIKLAETVCGVLDEYFKKDLEDYKGEE